MADTERLAQLRENLTEYFDLEELRTLSFDLGVDWDRLRGEEKAGKVTAMKFIARPAPTYRRASEAQALVKVASLPSQEDEEDTLCDTLVALGSVTANGVTVLLADESIGKQ